MSFWDGVKDFGEGLIGQGDGGLANDIGKGIGFLTPLGAIDGAGSIAGTMGGMTGDANAFGGGGGGSSLPGMGGLAGLAGALGGMGGGGGGGGQQFYTPQQAPAWAAPQAAGDPAAQAAQAGLLTQLQAQAAGHGPSLAAMQAQKQGDVAMRQQLAASVGNRNNAMAGYDATQAGANIQGNIAGQSAMARAQEELNAQQGIGALAGQMRGQTMQNNQFNANQQQQGNQFFNQEMLAQQQGLQNFGYQSALQQMQNDQATKNALIGGAFSAGGTGLQMLAKGA